MRILFLDIEVSPTLATVWGLFNQNISINQLLGNSEVLTWAATWLDNPNDIKDGSLLRDGKRKMLKKIHELLNEADAVVTWNGDDFDLKILNKEFLLQRLPPPAPYHSLDIIKTSRQKFRFTSNKLAYVAEQLGATRKRENRGHELWLDCMARKPSAFREMLVYNRGDLPPLIGIYKRFLPWITKHPNVYLYPGAPKIRPDRPACPTCRHPRVVAVKNRVKASGTYTQWQCQSPKCGRYFTDRKPIKGSRSPVAA